MIMIENRTEQKPKSLGILGGMGPLASAEYLMAVLNQFQVERDSQYPRIILDSNTLIPSRGRAFLYNEASPVPGMIEACKQLENYNVDYIAIPCNSAQAWLKDVQSQITTPILDIREITVRTLIEGYPDCKQAVVFGSPVTYGMDTYAEYLKKENIQYIKITPSEQKQVERIIYDCKKNCDRDSLRTLFANLLQEVKEKYGHRCTIILGCTEFGLLSTKELLENVCAVDSNFAYACFTAEVLRQQ